MKLHWKIIIGMLLGVVAGLAMNESFVLPGALGALFGKLSFLRHFLAAALAPVIDVTAEIFIRLLKMLIVPLIFASMVMGVARVGDVRRLGKMGAKTVVFYLVTTWAPVLVGLTMVNIIRPGVGAPLLGGEVPPAAMGSVTLKEIILNMIPTNPVKAMAEMDILPLIFFSLLFGSVLTTLGKKGEPLISFFDSFNEAMMKLTDVVIRLAPAGVFALLARVVVQTGPAIFANLGKYMATVLVGLAVHAFVTLPLILWFFGRVRPRRYAGAVAPALTTAFSTASSSATLPLTMECVERRAGVPGRIGSFVLHLGATVNMDGTALYESVAAVFIAQVYGIHLGLTQQVLVFLTATLAAIGAAGIPSAGLVTMAIVLRAVGLPLDGIGMILAVDRILDMCRTTVNVWGDTVGCAVVARLEGEGAAFSGGKD